jgi:hypothetical protein
MYIKLFVQKHNWLNSRWGSGLPLFYWALWKLQTKSSNEHVCIFKLLELLWWNNNKISVPAAFFLIPSTQSHGKFITIAVRCRMKIPLARWQIISTLISLPLTLHWIHTWVHIVRVIIKLNFHFSFFKHSENKWKNLLNGWDFLSYY